MKEINRNNILAGDWIMSKNQMKNRDNGKGDRIKIYLDTNMVLDFFINQAKFIRKKQELKIPRKYIFMIKSEKKVNFITSFIAKAEIFRELVSGYGMSKNQIEPVWEEFLESLSCKYIKSHKFDETIVDIVSKIKMKLRTMFNYMHIFITMEYDAYFVSGDKDIVNKVKRSGLYRKAITYPELIKIIERLD